MERLRKQGADLVYHCPKPLSSGKRADLVLTPHGSPRKTPRLCACKTLTGALSVGDVDGPNL